jgi:hypothetical protein
MLFSKMSGPKTHPPTGRYSGPFRLVLSSWVAKAVACPGAGLAGPLDNSGRHTTDSSAGRRENTPHMKALVEPDGHVVGVWAEVFPVHRKYKWVDVPEHGEVTAGWFYRLGVFTRPRPGAGGRGAIANFLADPSLRPTGGGAIGGAAWGDFHIALRGRDASQRFVRVDLPLVSGLLLTVQDLHALGAIVAQWAIAESSIKSHVQLLAACSGEDKAVPWEFGRVQERWKELLKKVCGASAKHLEIGRALAGAAKILKEDRDAACHWPAGRSGFRTDIDARFVQVGTADPPSKTFTTAELLSLSERIFDLGDDVRAFDGTIMPDLFPERVTYVGAPAPTRPTINSVRFVTLENPPRAAR